MAGQPLELRRTLTDGTLAASLPGFSVVGLAGVLNAGSAEGYRARATSVPGQLVDHGFRWRLADEWSGTWWPQGIAVGEFAGRQIALVSWYAQPRLGVEQGARISVVDQTDAARPIYRHVLLVSPRPATSGVVLDPVLAHAGGIAWSADRLLVAATFDGIREFRLSDIRRSERPAGGPFGYDFVLPQFAHHQALDQTADTRLRYSFLTVDTEAGAAGTADDPLALIAGEYGRDETHLVARLTTSGDQSVVTETHVPGVVHMQGAAVDDGTWFISSSRGDRAGDLWVGRIDALRELAAVVPAGPEALAVWPERGELWSLSEIRGKRYVYAMKIDALREAAARAGS